VSRGPDVGTALVRVLLASSVAAGCAAALVDSDWERWASATFIGARHRVSVVASPSVALDAWIAALPDAEFAIAGHLVADLTVARVARRPDEVAIDIEALTVEQR